jgi:hypothetical protein
MMAVRLSEGGSSFLEGLNYASGMSRLQFYKMRFVSDSFRRSRR